MLSPIACIVVLSNATFSLRITETMARTRKNTVSPASLTIDWSVVEAQLNGGTKVSLSILAKSLKVFPIDLRKIFATKYGDRIVFKRGRTGGVYWKAANTTAAAQAVTV
jgi:hypothetical protein